MKWEYIDEETTLPDGLNVLLLDKLNIYHVGIIKEHNRIALPTVQEAWWPKLSDFRFYAIIKHPKG